MRSIEGVLPEKISKAICLDNIGNAPAIILKKYSLAELSYLNKDYLIFFRGQKRDYINKIII